MTILVTIDCGNESGEFTGDVGTITFETGDTPADMLLMLTCGDLMPFEYCGDSGIMIDSEPFSIKSKCHLWDNPYTNHIFDDQVGMSEKEAARLANYLKGTYNWYAEDGREDIVNNWDDVDIPVDFVREKLIDEW